MRKQTVCRSRIMPDWQTNKGCRIHRQPSHKNNYFLLLFKSSDYSRASNFSFNLSLGAAPTNLSTICPPLKKSIVGMLRTPKSSAISAFSSTSHFPTISLPSYSSASSEMIAPRSPEVNNQWQFAVFILFEVLCRNFYFHFIISCLLVIVAHEVLHLYKHLQITCHYRMFYDTASEVYRPAVVVVLRNCNLNGTAGQQLFNQFGPL